MSPDNAMLLILASDFKAQSWVDLDLIKYAMDKLNINPNSRINMSITHADEIEKSRSHIIVDNELIQFSESSLSYLFLDNLNLNNVYLYNSPKIEGNNE